MSQTEITNQICLGNLSTTSTDITIETKERTYCGLSKAEWDALSYTEQKDLEFFTMFENLDKPG